MKKLGRGESAKVRSGQYYNEFIALAISESERTSSDGVEIVLDDWSLRSPIGESHGSGWMDLYTEFEIIFKKYNLSAKGKMIAYVYDVRRLFALCPFEILDEFKRHSKKTITALTSQFIEFRDLRSLFGDMVLPEILSRFAKTESSDLQDISNGIHLIISEKCDRFGDIRKIPQTLVGEVKESLNDYFKEQYPKSRERKEYRSDIRFKSPRQPLLYEGVTTANHGGLVLANALYVGQPIKNVTRKDRESCYPAIMLSHEFPCTEWVQIDSSVEALAAALSSDEFAVMSYIIFDKIKIKPGKLPHISGSHGLIDGGKFDISRKLISADSFRGWFMTYQIRLILATYDIESIGISCQYVSRLSMLPDWILSGVSAIYEQKRILKKYAKESSDYFYVKKKLNCIAGLMQEKPRNCDESDYSSLNWSFRGKKYNLAWGAWLTSIGQWQLYGVVDELGDDLIYAHTDSVAYVGNHDEVFERFNSRDNRDYIGGFRPDEFAVKFKTLGSNRYGFQDSDGKITLHISGLPVGTTIDSLDELTEKTVFRNVIKIDTYHDDECRITRKTHDLPMSEIGYGVFNLAFTDKEYNAL